MTYSIILLLILLTLVETWAQVYKFNNYKVYRLIPTSDDHMSALQEFVNHGTDYDVWQEPSKIYSPVDIMVPPYKMKDFHCIIKQMGIEHKLIIRNVQKLVNECAPVRTTDWIFGSTQYHTLDEIHGWLKDLHASYSEVVTMVMAGSSYEERNILGVSLSYKDGSQAIIFEGGIHAREWISPAVITFILNEILTNDDVEFRKIVEDYNWYFFPVVNPDGYVHSHTTNRLWKKSRQPYGDGIGVDLNRNWNIYWNQSDNSDYPSSNAYPGSRPFSEPESRTFAAFLSSMQCEIIAYFSFHSYSQQILFPYGCTEEHLDNYDQLLEIGEKATLALYRRYGTEYMLGSTSDILGITTGSSVDWVKAKLHIPITYTFGLRDLGRYGFLLPPDQIIPSGEETLDAILTIIKEVKKYEQKN